MAPSVRCRIESAAVRAEKEEALTALIRQLFNRRHLAYIASNERSWLTVELVQSLRRQSRVYRALSTKTSGPLPFALGYFRVTDGALDLVSNTLPLDDSLDGGPEVLVRLLSEYVAPGARLTFATDAGDAVWVIRGVDDVERVRPAAADGPASSAENDEDAAS